MSYTPREMESTLRKYFQEAKPPFNVLLLSGARQTGKSTLLGKCLPPKDHHHINLSLEASFCRAIDATRDFDDFTFLIERKMGHPVGGSQILIIDEAQLSSNLGRYVRFMKEKWKNQPVILTGSTLSTLFDNKEKPTGRVIEYTLRPFNFFEFLSAVGEELLLEKLRSWSVKTPLSPVVHEAALEQVARYLKVGGLPEVVRVYREKGDYLEILSNIFAFYQRDFQEKLSDENATSIFGQIFLRVAAATGSPVTHSSIIKSSSPGYRKLPAILSVLEQCHQILKVHCETSQLSKVGTVTPKRYIFDHGIRFLQNPGRFSGLDLLHGVGAGREELGCLVENFVLTELVSIGSLLPIRSWSKTHQSGHIDFVFPLENQNHLIEVKAALKLNRKHLESLKTATEYFPKSNRILTNADRGGVISEGGSPIYNVPIYALYGYLKNRG